MFLETYWIDLEKATRTLFCYGESSKGLGRDIFYVVSKYMLRRERKTSHFGVVGEREEDELKVGKCGRKYKERVSDFQIIVKKINNSHVFLIC